MLPTPAWFMRAGMRGCGACDAIRRYPNRARPPFAEFRAHLLLVAESKHLRRTSGQNKCQSCGMIHEYDESRRKRWRHLCIPCEGLHKRIYRERHRDKKSSRMQRTIRSALNRSGESARVKEMLGYTISDLRRHLELQFTDGMSWSNMSKWHIDHIVPQASFDLSDEIQWRKCWCMSNLRPMWGKDNIKKGAKPIFLL